MSGSISSALETPKKVITHFHITGFGEFRGVTNNPTEQLINSLPAYIEQHPLPSTICLESLSVLETSGVASRQALTNLTNAACAAPTDDNTTHAQVYLHFGVHAGSTTFKLESTAYNFANFRVPDQLGWQPIEQAILPESDAPKELKTTLDLNTINRQITCMSIDGDGASGDGVANGDAPARLGAGRWQCAISTDPGRFVCNWIFFHSLHRAAREPNTHSLFVHVPAHDVYDLQAQQAFAREVIIAIGQTLQQQQPNSTS